MYIYHIYSQNEISEPANTLQNGKLKLFYSFLSRKYTEENKKYMSRQTSSISLTITTAGFGKGIIAVFFP